MTDECPTCHNTGRQPMYDGAEKDGNFWLKCDDCGRTAAAPEMCDDCPLRNECTDECMPHPERKARLVLYAASGVPVQCHKAIDPDIATELLGTPDKDWRLDHPVTVPCRGYPVPPSALKPSS